MTTFEHYVRSIRDLDVTAFRTTFPPCRRWRRRRHPCRRHDDDSPHHRRRVVRGSAHRRGESLARSDRSTMIG